MLTGEIVRIASYEPLMPLVLFVLSVKETQQLILMLGGEHTVISQAADLIDDPIVMYKTTHHIKGKNYDTS